MKFDIVVVEGDRGRMGLYVNGGLEMDDFTCSQFRVSTSIQARIEGFMDGVDMVCDYHPDGYSYTLSQWRYVGPESLSEGYVHNGLPMYLTEIQEVFLELI